MNAHLNKLTARVQCSLCMTYQNYMHLAHDIWGHVLPLYMRACTRSNIYANLCTLVSCNSRANMWL